MKNPRWKPGHPTTRDAEGSTPLVDPQTLEVRSFHAEAPRSAVEAGAGLASRDAPPPRARPRCTGRVRTAPHPDRDPERPGRGGASLARARWGRPSVGALRRRVVGGGALKGPPRRPSLSRGPDPAGPEPETRHPNLRGRGG